MVIFISVITDLTGKQLGSTLEEIVVFEKHHRNITSLGNDFGSSIPLTSDENLREI